MKHALVIAICGLMLGGLLGQTLSNVKASQDARFGYYRISFDLSGEQGQAFNVKAIPHRKDMRINEPMGIWSRTIYPAGSGHTIFWYPCLDGVEAGDWDFDVEAVESPMVHVLGGKFIMGSEAGPPNEAPVHPVYVDNYYIRKQELSVSEYSAFLDSTGYKPMAERGSHVWQLDGGNWIKYDSAPWLDPQLRLATRHPVSCLTWYDLIPYCNWRSRMEGLKPVYSYGRDAYPENWTTVQVECDFGASGYRLPTEAEWEYAARGGKHSQAYLYSGSNTSDEVAWHQANSQNRPCRLGVKAPNELGLFDMSGNVWEWCWDWYDQDYYATSPQTNPSGKIKGLSRVFRGGSYAEPETNCRVSQRNHLEPLSGTLYLGARLVSSGRKSISGPGDKLLDEIEALTYWLAIKSPSSSLRVKRDAEIQALLPPGAMEQNDDEFLEANPQIVKQAQQIYDGYEARIATYSRQFERQVSGLKMRLYRLLAATRENVKMEGSLGDYDSNAQMLRFNTAEREFAIKVTARQYKELGIKNAKYQINAYRLLNNNLDWDYRELSIQGPLGKFDSDTSAEEIVDMSAKFQNTVSPAQARNQLLRSARREIVSKALPDWITFQDIVADAYGGRSEYSSLESASEIFEYTALANRLRAGNLIDEEFIHTKSDDQYECKVRYQAELPLPEWAEPDVELKVELAKGTDFKARTLIVNSDQEGYLYVFEISPEKRVTLLFPSTAEPVHRITANQAWRRQIGVPAQPEGLPETLYIVYSRFPLPVKNNTWFDGPSEETRVNLGEESLARFQYWLSDSQPGTLKDLLLEVQP